MINYVAAIATAVTLAITPVPSALKDDPAKEGAQWAKAAVMKTLEIGRSIELSGLQPMYFLSTVEQRIFRKALLRSVKIISPGTPIA